MNHQLPQTNPTQQKQFPSTVGNVIDVATPTAGKLRMLGVFWTVIFIFPFVLINYLIFSALTSDNSILTSGRVVPILGSLLMPVIGWFALGSAIQRFRSAGLKDKYFRAGPGGISVCVPDDSIGATFKFSFRTLKFDLAWDQIKTWYPYVESMNGIPTERSMVFANLRGEKVKIKNYHFAENQKELTACIDRARRLQLTNDESANSEATGVSLPPGVGEVSFEVKKKRDRIGEIDLSSTSFGSRLAAIERLAKVSREQVSSLLPNAEGYKHKQKHYRPFPEWKDVYGIRLLLRQGLLRGYEIQLEPNDSECRKVTVSICPSNRIADVSKWVSAAVGVGCLVISFKWMPSIRDGLGELSQLTPLVVLLIGLAGMGVSMGILQVPIGLLRAVMVDKVREDLEKQRIKDELSTSLR
jgi:hypothetical protein